MFRQTSSACRFKLFACLLLSPILMFHLTAPVSARQLEAALCLQPDLLTGEFSKIESLTAGGDGFIVALSSRYPDTVLVNLTWEQLLDQAPGSKQLSETMQVVGANQTSFVPFSAPEGGLTAGQFRVVLSITGQPKEILNFMVTPPHPPDTQTQSDKKTVSEALSEVFQTTEGPESAQAGIEVITQFFDQELNTPANAPDVPPQMQAASPENEPKLNPDKAQQQIVRPVESQEINQKKKAPSTVVASPSAVNQITSTTSNGIEVICARQITENKTPVDTPEFFHSSDDKIFLAMRSSNPAVKDLVTIEWFALEVEGLPAGKKLTSSREILRVDSWNTATFFPPSGGYLPGTYHVKVSKESVPLAQVDFRIESRHETAPLLTETTLPKGMNIAHAGMGGTVLSATSEYNNSSWSKEGLIDGYGFGGENCQPSCGWASSDRKFPQELIFSFFQEKEAHLEGVIIDGESCSGDDTCIQSLPRLIEIWVSTDTSDGTYTLATVKRLKPFAERHFITLGGVRAKYLKLVVKSNYGSARRTQLAEVEILEKPGPTSIVGELPINLAFPGFGGSVVRYSSQKYGGEAARLLQEHRDNKGWRSSDKTLPQEVTFCLRDDGEALLDRLVLNLNSGYDPSTRPKEIAVLLSSKSPVDGFVETARVDLPSDTDSFEIPLNSRARFVTLRILQNHGGDHTSLGRVALFEGSEPGYTSLLSQPAKPITSSTWSVPKVSSSLVTSKVQPSLSPEQAHALELGQRIEAQFEEFSQKHYYTLELEGDQPGMLNLELMGLPFLRTRLILKNSEGAEKARFNPRRNASTETVISWMLEPGRYLLEAESTPAFLVLAWDVSRSMAAHTDILEQAVTGFLEHVQPSEKISLIAFNNNIHVLTKEFTSDRKQLLTAVSGKFKTEMATRLYDAVEKGIKLLGETKGVGAMVIMTDGADMGSALKTPQFWEIIDKNHVRMFTIGFGGELKVKNPETGLSGSHFLKHVAEAAGGQFIFIPGADQLVDVYQQVAQELMAETTYYLKPTWTFEPGSLLVKTVGERIEQVVTPPRIEIILDGSGSMKKKLGDKTRMAVAKDVLSKLVQDLPSDVEVALRVYGHRIKEGQKGDCQDTELVYPFGTLDKKRLISQINAVRPLGTTPTAYSLMQSADDFGEGTDKRTVILVTDGKEECGGDLAATVEELRSRGMNVRLHVVGFTVQNPAAEAEMKKAAEAGDGRYLIADDSQGLRKAMAQTLAIPFTVLDSGGHEVIRGTAGETLSLPAGYYQIVLDTPQGEIIQEKVLIAQNKTTLLKVTKDGPEIGVQVLSPGETQ